MSPAMTIARAELAWLSRSRLAQISAGIFLLLLALAVVTSGSYLQHAAEERHAHQSEATDIFENQPDRHPHRMVHYGQYVFRTPPPLASIDPGLDAFGGTSLFLEGHRQNAAMFAAAAEGSTLVRFGNLTPAFCLQVLAPLLLILIGHSAISREHESSTIKSLLAQGVGLREIALGKLLVLLAASGACLMVLAVAALISAAGHPGESLAALTMLGAYGIYLFVWSLIVVATSCLTRRSSTAFLLLASFWMLSSIVVPRLAADVASTAAPLESAFARSMQLKRELRALGDSHSPDDPNYKSFQSKVLEEYGVSSFEELPVNIRGLMAVEGERQGAEVLARFTEADQAARYTQQRLFSAAAVVSPVVALQLASQAIAGTDLKAYHRFLNEAESHRLAFVQALNMLQATEVDYALDKIKSVDVQAERATRVSAEAWRSLPQFEFAPATTTQRVSGAAMSLLVLALWLGAAGWLFLRSTGRGGL
ncbi:MAG: DUF3526 domain-containing protein [Congregibacter sp.]